MTDRPILQTYALLARLDAGTCDTRSAAATIRRLSEALREIATAKVGALIIAEIERLDRATPPADLAAKIGGE